VRDTRLVQTAVIGDEHSDVPVVLPTEAVHLDAFRRVHGHDTIWCGLLLGGCGAQLAHKLYVDRQCHFQHHPQPNGAAHDCRGPKVGQSSADHLYVKAAMSQSLLDYGRAGRFAFPPPIGSLLDVDLDDGVALRVHMDGSVAPDWAGDRTPVLGPGVTPEPGVLSRCPYVYRFRCENDGAGRRVWIGTQSLAQPTEWVPLADCAWSEAGLITPAATDILRRQSATISPAPARAQDAHRPGALPENVIRFIRGLEAAQRAGTVEHVRRLCDGSGDFLDRLDPAVRAEAEEALTEARSWLAGHEDYQQRVFAELEAAVAERRAWDVRSQLQTATALTRRGASAEEQRVLAAARAFVRKQDHLPADPARTSLHPLLAPRPKRPPARTKATPRPQPARKDPPKRHSASKMKERDRPQQTPAPAASRRERRDRGVALRRARFILDHLDKQRFHLSADEQRELARELETVADVAGDWLSAEERREVRFWIRKTSRPPRQGRPNPARQDLAPEVLKAAAAAVRGALKRSAREQQTTSWARLEQQLGSALLRMTLADRVQVLTLVDQSTPADQALLSSLVASGDPDMTTSYRKIASALGLDMPAGDGDLRDVVEADVQQVHSHWRHR
jgi:hypothetical protein